MQGVIEIQNLTHITYRGSLRSCNYNCPYCAIACKKSSNRAAEKELKQDREALERFCSWMEIQEFHEPVSVLIAPYGEALLYPVYWQNIARMSRLTQLDQISCQTNLSFPAASFFKVLKEEEACLKKIALWVTFHPSMVSPESFASKANQLSSQILLSVGVVGNPDNIEAIHQLKNLLDPSVYLWVNKMDGLGRKYTKEETAAFLAIDPFFLLEKTYAKNYGLCSGGKKSLFVRADGTAYPCCRSQIILGSIYQTMEPVQDCSGRCDCFLAYSNRRDLAHLAGLGKHPQLRLKRRQNFKAVFFDLDDSIYFKRDADKTRAAKDFLKACHQSGMLLFAVTALTRRQSERRLGSIKHLLSGGVFAYGAGIEMDVFDIKQYSTFSQEPDSDAMRIFRHQGEAYKLLVKEVSTRWEGFGSVYAEEQIAVVPHGCRKETGAAIIMNKMGYLSKDLIVIGNSEADQGLFALADCSVALEGAPEDVCEKAQFVLSPYHFTSLCCR